MEQTHTTPGPGGRAAEGVAEQPGWLEGGRPVHHPTLRAVSRSVCHKAPAAFLLPSSSEQGYGYQCSTHFRVEDSEVRFRGIQMFAGKGRDGIQCGPGLDSY